MHRGLKYIRYNNTEYLIFGNGYYEYYNMSYDGFKGLYIYDVNNILYPRLVNRIELIETVTDVDYYEQNGKLILVVLVCKEDYFYKF